MNISELRKKSNAFVRDLDLYIAIAVKNSEPIILKLNREQMLTSKLSTGSPILPTYSPGYAKKKGFKKPNLFVDGSFQKEMFLETNENKGTYFVGSFHEVSKYLEGFYGEDIFGLMQSNKKTVIPIASNELFKLFKQNVLNAG